MDNQLTPEWRAGFLRGRAAARAHFAAETEDDVEQSHHLAMQAEYEARAIEEARG